MSTPNNEEATGENYEEDDYESNDDCYDEFDNHIDNDEDDFINEDESDNLYSNDPEYFDYECYPLEKIDWILESKCEKVMSVLKLDDPFDALYLLKQFKWNAQRIIEVYHKDEQLFREAYFSDNNNNKSNTPATSSTSHLDRFKLDSFVNIFSSESKIFKIKSPSKLGAKPRANVNYCNICCTNKPNADHEMIALEECKHFFCYDCWRLHFESLISLGTTSFFECMETKCKSIASKDFVLKCLEHKFDSPENFKAMQQNEKKNLKQMYKRLVAGDLIKESDDLSLCPGDLVRKDQTVRCTFVVWAKANTNARRVICTSCQTQFCFLCTFPYHAPNSCQTIKKWLIKCQDDSETRNYLLVHTQDCPKCGVCIEKNGGCSHMTCNRCKHEFCWTCLNDWKTHGATYDCNRYKGNPELDNAREALNRYTQ